MTFREAAGRPAPRWPRRRPAPVPCLIVLGMLGTLGTLGGCVRRPEPGREPSLAENVVELGDAISELRQENAVLQAQLDSLRRMVARQDTVLRQLANLAGAPMPP